MKWIKASERLPTKEGYNYFVKANSYWQPFCHNDTATFKNGIWTFRQDYVYHVEEWLDESTDMDESERTGWQQQVDDLVKANKELQEDNYRLRIIHKELPQKDVFQLLSVAEDGSMIFRFNPLIK